MSTNAVIRLEGGFPVEAYKHWDGYPEGVLKWLQDFNKEFAEKRGDDNQYKFAQLLRSSAFDADKYNLDSSRQLGWGVDKIDSFYFDYLYVLKKDGSIEIWSSDRKNITNRYIEIGA